MQSSRTELTFHNGEEDITASVLFRLYPESPDDFQVESVIDAEGRRIEEGEILYQEEIQRAFEEHLINRPR